MSMVVGKVRIRPESFSMSFIKYIGCIIFESIGKPSGRVRKSRGPLKFQISYKFVSSVYLTCHF